MNYLKLLQSKKEYIDISTNLPDSTIVVCKDGNIIYKDNNKYLIAIYNITDISEPTTLFSVATNTSVTSFVYSIEIDGEQQELTTSTNFTFDYQFTTTGEHLAKIYPKPTWQGNTLNSFFYNNSNLLSIRIPKQIEKTGNGCFYHCTNLTDVIIDYDSEFTEIAGQSFEGCTSLKNINLYNAQKITKFTGNCFNGIAIEELNIPKNIVTIEYQSFSNCTSLKTVYVPLNSKLTTIERSAFSDCTNLKTLYLTNTITRFEDNVFLNCSLLDSIIDLKSCTYIGDSAFKNCTKLNFKNIGNVSTIGGTAFYGTNIITAEIKENATLGTQIFNNCSNLETLIFKGDFTMDDWTKGLAQNCPKLTNIIFKKQVSKLPENCFLGNTGLTSIDLSKVTELSDNGIGYEFHNIVSCIFSPTLTRIPNGMFSSWDNTNLTVTIPATVTEISNEAFTNCKGTFYILAVTPPTLSATSAINNNMTIYVPAASLEAYKAAEYWSNVANRIFAITE